MVEVGTMSFLATRLTCILWFDKIASMSKVFAGMAASLDGYIQSRDKDLSWLNNAMARDEDYGFEVTSKRTGAYVLGANTYREVAGMGGGGDTTPTYVLTRDKSLKTNKSTRLFSGDPTGLIEKIKSEIDPYKDICVFGGGEIVSQFIELGLLDELTVSVIPVLLGDGVPFFNKLKGQRKLELIGCRHFKSGIVILEYKT